MIDRIMTEIYAKNIARCYAICDRKLPEEYAITERAEDFAENIRGVGFGDVRRLFDIARSNFNPIPTLKNLSDSVPLLNGEREAMKIHRIESPASATLMQRLNRAEALKIYAARTGTWSEYVSDPSAYASAHYSELRAVYDYDNAPPPGCCAGLNELRTN